MVENLMCSTYGSFSRLICSLVVLIFVWYRSPAKRLWVLCGHLLFINKSRTEGTIICLLLLVILIFVITFFHSPVVIFDVSSRTLITTFLMSSFSEMQIFIFRSTIKTWIQSYHVTFLTVDWMPANNKH